MTSPPAGRRFQDLAEQVAAEERRPEADGGARRRPPRLAVLLAVLVVAAGLLAIPRIRGREDAWKVPASRLDDSAELVLQIAIHEVEAETRRSGRLPESIRMGGFSSAGFRYEADGTRCRLTVRGANGPVTISGRVEDGRWVADS